MANIGETIVGLTTYEVRIDDKKLDEYIKFSESHESPSVGIWAFVTAIVLLLLNNIGKQLKNNYAEEYGVRKVIETFYNMKVLDEITDAGDRYHFGEDNFAPKSPIIGLTNERESLQ